MTCMPDCVGMLEFLTFAQDSPFATSVRSEVRNGPPTCAPLVLQQNAQRGGQLATLQRQHQEPVRTAPLMASLILVGGQMPVKNRS
mmetsp:Transcript_54095/g.104586  ORF Transcript_54095/g.104586 Transcript_54095/m.104586 type:complete len:86 (+) Transcript_54095:110-367(+)